MTLASHRLTLTDCVGKIIPLCHVVLYAAVLSASAGAAEARVEVQTIPFEWHKDFTDSDMAAAASVIVVGVVHTLEAVGLPKRATDDAGYEADWQLLRASISVENSIKGETATPNIQMYYYVVSGPVMGDWNSLNPYLRYVFFLKSDSGVFRAVRDFWRSSIEVGSGRHSHHVFPGRQTPRESVATLLLTPGKGMDAVVFQRKLYSWVWLAQDWIGLCRTVALVKTLSRNSDVRIRNSARPVLTMLLDDGQAKSCSPDPSHR